MSGLRRRITETDYDWSDSTLDRWEFEFGVLTAPLPESCALPGVEPGDLALIWIPGNDPGTYFGSTASLACVTTDLRALIAQGLASAPMTGAFAVRAASDLMLFEVEQRGELVYLHLDLPGESLCISCTEFRRAVERFVHEIAAAAN